SHDELRVAQLDRTTLLLAVGVAVLSGVVFGVIGMLQAARQSTHDALKAGTRSMSGSRGQHRVRSLLVITEMALSAMLVVGASLAVRSVINLQHTDLGFDPSNLYTFFPSFPPQQFPTAASRATFMREYMQRVRRIPGVRAASIASVGPGSRWFSIGRFEIQGEPEPPKGTTSFTDLNAV